MAKFSLLKKLLPPEEKIFYTLFEQGASVAKDASELFHQIMLEGLTEEKIIEAKKLKHQSNSIAKETLTQLNLTFITPIDREDIQLVASLLNKITKRIVKAAVNLRVYRIETPGENMVKQSETLVHAVQELVLIVNKLKNLSKVEQITDNHNKMREIESHGDELLYFLMEDLFSGDYDALTVIKRRDIYKDIENALDSCSSLSDAVVNIVLKHT